MEPCKKTHNDCEGCCNCCKYMIDGPYSPHEEKAIEYYQKRSCDLTKSTSGKLWFFIYAPCPQLDEDTGLCKIYDARPRTCKEFPVQQQFNGPLRHICKRIQTLREDRQKKYPYIKTLKF